MTHQLQPIVTANFIHSGHNMGDDAPDASAQVFARETTIDAEIGATVPAKDKPHLTQNDKVYAARLSLGTIGPDPVAAAAPIDDDEDEQ